MGAFDKSYHELLGRYNSINEQRYQIIDTTTGKPVGATDQIPAGINNSFAQVKSGQVSAATAPTQPAPAQTTQTPTPPAGQIAATAEDAEPTAEQKSQFQRLHGTPYNPKSNMDRNKMQLQRQAETETGGDFNKLKQAVYSGKSVNPLNAGKPGQPTGGNNMIIKGGQGDTPARQVDLNTGQSTEIPKAVPVFRPGSSVTSSKPTGAPPSISITPPSAQNSSSTATPTKTTSTPSKPAPTTKTTTTPRERRGE